MKLFGRRGVVAFIMLTMLAPVALCAATPAAQNADAVRITLLHVNDVHGQLEGMTDQDGRGVGGYARLATAVNEIRASQSADGVFLIHAGDEFSKADTLTMRTQGRANIAIMNQVGFDFWVPGNGDVYGGVGMLRKRIGEAKFQVLAANLKLKETGRGLADAYVIRTVRGVRIGFVGLCFIRVERSSADPLQLIEHTEVARELVPEIRKSADVVVAITHIGYGADQQLAAAVPGIDVIIGGHSHTVVPSGKRIKGADRDVLICQAGDELKYLGRVDLAVRKAGSAWKVENAKATLLPLDQKVKLDPKVTALIAKFASESEKPAAVPQRR